MGIKNYFAFKLTKKQMKRTKIIATIGPASEKEEILRKMIEDGMNIARLNFSHGDYDWHAGIIDKIRKLAEEKGVSVGILADLQGPRIRVLMNEDLKIESGEQIWISDISAGSDFPPSSKEKKQKIIQLDQPGIIQEIRTGQDILIADGIIKLKVVAKENNFLKAEVIDGGVVGNHKGVNIPGADLKLAAITSKDEKDLEFALKKEADFVALSFVSSFQDILDLRKKMKNILGRENGLPQIVAKIERKQAIDNLDEILETADAAMVARGDLGIEMDESKVAVLQKEIIKKSLERVKPVIVATQMLDSMIENARPTRAEVSDVSNAVIDHADALMLSGETASGKYPAESVKIMADIIQETEVSPFDDIYKALDFNIASDYAVIIRSAFELAKSFGAKAILMISVSGFTARLMSHFRPQQRLLVATNSRNTFNQLSLVWGIEEYFFNDDDLDSFIERMAATAKKSGELRTGDKVIIILGKMPGGEKMRLIGVKQIK